MKILFLDSPAFAKLDMIDAFRHCNIDCDLFLHEKYKERKNTAFSAYFDSLVEKKIYDFVFSFNYYPSISNCCQKHNLKYVSYVYDSPQVALYSYSLTNPCNYVFTFDKHTFEYFRNNGITTIYYLPLAANVKRLSSISCPKEFLPKLQCDVSFVGSIYNEDHNFFDRLNTISEYTRGYLDAIMKAQQNTYGYFFLENLLTPNILSDLQKACPYTPMSDGVETASYIYANYFLCRKITSCERLSLLKIASECSKLNLYTHHPVKELPKANYIGPIDYYDIMPLVFKNSQINLNISLKSIQTGIPLRCMDIMGCGGFLLTNFQSDFMDYFIPGEDFIYYESESNFRELIKYYLLHEKDRQQIKDNAFGKMKDFHTFEHRIHEILHIIQ